MDFKKFKQEIKQEELNIPSLNENVRAYSRKYEKSVVAKERKNYFSYFKYAAILAPVIIMLLLVSIISLSANFTGNNYGLYSVKDEIDFKRILSYNNDYDFGFDEFDKQTDTNGKQDILEGANSAKPSTGPAGEKGDYSETNNQENNVDEADIVKTDGKKIYYYNKTRNQIYVYNVLSSDLEFIKLNNDFQNGLLYLSNKYLIMLGFDNSKVLVNIYDKETLDIVLTYNNHGYLVDSRVTKEVLYIVYNQRNVTNKPTDYLNDELQNYDYEEIKYSRLTINEGYTYIVAVDLNTLEFNSIVQLGANRWTTVYATENSIYLAVSEYCYKLDEAIIGKAFFGGSSTQTTIFRYELDGININYKGIIITEGSVKDQFFLDEYEGHLRVVLERIVDSSNSNKLEVYDLSDVDNTGVIKKVASIDEGIGKPRESIKSVKFSDNSCLIVTYLVTDPLYYIDLTNQLKPYIKGEYQEPGYNTYLHYLSDSLAIGFGVDKSYKLGLYDISNGTPNKIDQIDDYSRMEVASNHKALYIENEVFGFSSTIIKQIKVDHVITHKNIYLYQLFTINYDTETPSLELLLEVHDDENIDRMIRIEQAYYFISGKNIIIYNTDLELINKISIK